jgi:hypothetical protein
MNKMRFLLIFLLIFINKLWAQQAFTVTDTQPLLMNGLTIGYNIKSVEVKTVGDKGDFSRYVINFYVTNNDNVAKMIRFREGYNDMGVVSDQLVQFNIINATGARLTSTSATISAAPYIITIPIDRDRRNDPNNQPKTKQIGYWIQAGQTIAVDEIVIVPLNQMPNVQAIFKATTLQPVPNIQIEPRHFEEQPRQDFSDRTPRAADFREFVEFKNKYNGSFINIERGPIVSTEILPGWYSAQWLLVPIPNSNLFSIKNRWKQTYLDIDFRNNLELSFSSFSMNASWLLEQTSDPNVYRLRNNRTGLYLCINNNQLILSNDFNDEYSSTWYIINP